MITIGVKWIQVENAHNEYCGRGSVFGNPFAMKDMDEDERNRVCDLFQEHFRIYANKRGHPLREGTLRLLRLAREGKAINLQCFCAGKRCHCETIKAAIEQHL